MTNEFLRAASDECLDYRPQSDFMTVREQAAHLCEVQGAYQLAFSGEPVDFARKGEFAPPSLERDAIIDTLAELDRRLIELLDTFRDDPDAFRLDWFGSRLGIPGFTGVFIQHEALHHGQWAAYAALGGYPRPIGWLMNWGL